MTTAHIATSPGVTHHRSEPGVLDFFAHHGVWAPGVRLFRTANFTSKALLVSLAFMVPIVLLLSAYMQTVQESISFATRERAGIELLRVVEPWQIEVQKQRRMVMSGLAAGVDVAAIEATLGRITDAVAARPGGLDTAAALARATESHRALLDAVRAANDATHLAKPLQDYVDAIRMFRNAVLDISALTLDPEQATYYVMSASTIVVPDLIESVSRSRALAGLAEPSGPDAAQTRLLYAIWYGGAQSIDTITDQLVRAAQAEPSVASRLPAQDATLATRAFFEMAHAEWFGDRYSASVEKLGEPGQRSVDALRKISSDGVKLLDELLEARISKATHQRNTTIVVLVLSLATVAYLFYSFFLVMSGGLSEVERHLIAMSAGDLTTSPRPWGKDEAARLMLTLSAMQGSLRSIVSEVRAASDGLVTSSQEIASASNDLSMRSEQAAASLEESASAMEQISQTVQQTAACTHSAAGIATNNAVVSRAGGQTIAEVICTMEGVKDSSSRIADITGIIDGIAFQTNILALNAAVEAARAGEQGRGFAVVASEVRALAQRSASAAKEIKSLIITSGERVDTGSRVVARAGEQMGELVSAAEQMKTLMSQVMTGTTEQSSGIRLVGESLQTLDQQTQQNAALVEETAAAAASVHEQALALSARVARFKLPA